MVLNLTANQQYLRVLNRCTVFEEISKNGALSRADLQKKTGLTATAISNIVGDLLRNRLIIEYDGGMSTGGRPPKLLDVDKIHWGVLGVDIDPAIVTVGLMDLKGTIIALRSKKLADSDINNVADIVKELATDVSRDSNRKVLAAGVGIPGWVYPKTQVVAFAPNLNWKDVDLKFCLNEKLQIPVYLDNEANVTAMGEGWAGCAQNIDNFIAVNFRTGVGSGIVIDGLIYRGISGSSGEIGHITVDEGGRRCSCGNYGCLETIASTPAICERFKKKKGDMHMAVDVKVIADSAKSGDHIALEVLRDTGKYIGIAFSMAVNLLNPQLVILGGDAVEYGEIILPEIEQSMRSKALSTSVNSCSVKISSLGKTAPVVGAGILALQSHLSNII
ncbi:ROK family protein (putative glucokinase) [Caldanaerobius fijiensis DSM 17918]|uniref:ROK family protein (Putative glucokinase) n=1 Tax=Caldanaerobius fijiensis DSM 17918 TaxID=1121256 RepID=A0A1M5AAU5_9THEO|nr:ROK family protein [Caldanaerobius fijiensis]SHF27431.1 ROK family protein (putative glucokinase) [Caldanaerobius fijiensis DSM 17918]